MAIKHNNQLPNNHFHKDWQRRVRCHFDQPGRKRRRARARRAKAAAVAPRPIDKLRPIVRCPTIKYNRRVRAGRGFSFAELKEAGICRKLAPTIGIAIDWRRRNISEEGLAVNVARLKEYKSRLIIFPRKSRKGKSKAKDKPDLTGTVSSLGASMPIVSVDKSYKEISKSDMPSAIEGGAYNTLHKAWVDKRLQGKREKKAAEKAEADAAKK